MEELNTASAGSVIPAEIRKSDGSVEDVLLYSRLDPECGGLIWGAVAGKESDIATLEPLIKCATHGWQCPK